ncbi:hypothetical protein [Haloarcula sp. JP-L23]|uniref:hypothetical protein n=1 Tax=Haloarcula sp. JP-L23 TaxID=2716717 RepID=UPI00140E9BEA|nr:hypothetical protein G9465_24845 [Haloarcula sp. JP-L23]
MTVQEAGDEQFGELALDISEGDTFELSFIADGEEQTTRQRVVNVTDKGATTVVYGEDSPGWNGPSVGLLIDTTGVMPSLKGELRHPMRDPTPVDEFTDLTVNPEEAED